MTLIEDSAYEYDQYLPFVNRLLTLHDQTKVYVYRVKKLYGKHAYVKNIILLNIEGLYNIIYNYYICVMDNLTGQEIIITHTS
jgi:hypothetical protein